MKNGVLLASAFLLAAACAPDAYKYRVGIATAETPEGNACRRECLAMVGVCSNTLLHGQPVYPVVGPYSDEFGCPGVISDCLATCPGARLVDGGPRLVPLRAAVPDDWHYADH